MQHPFAGIVGVESHRYLFFALHEDRIAPIGQGLAAGVLDFPEVVTMEVHSVWPSCLIHEA